MSDSENPFSAFTYLASLVVEDAQKSAERFNQIITPDHLLLGILHHPESPGHQQLLKLDINVKELQNAVEAHLALSVPSTDQPTLYYSQEVRRVLALSLEETKKSATESIDTFGLLIGIVEEATSFSAQELKIRGVSARRLRKHFSELTHASDHLPTPSEKESLKIFAAPPQLHKPARSQNWERFLPSARLLLATAQDYAIEFGQEKLIPDHLLLSILSLPEFDAYHCLTNLQVNIDQLQQALTQGLNSSTQDQPVLKVLLSDEVKRVLELSVEEARLASAHYLNTRFLLLGILREGTSFAAKELTHHGVSLHSIRNQRQHVREESHLEPDDTSQRSTNGRINRVIFPLMVAGFIAAGYLMVNNPFDNSFPNFLFVTIGWMISLSLHEFGHAMVAYWSGDKSVSHKGYLTLNPIRYTHPILSMLLPLLFLLAGGLGLPGGAVYINMDMIDGRYKKSLISAAGPLATAIVGLVCSVPFYLQSEGVVQILSVNLWAALSLLTYLQISALCLTLLPLPGFDGFGIIEPFLPMSFQRQAIPLSRYTIFAVVFLFYIGSPFSEAYWQTVDTVSEIIGVPTWGIQWGFEMFRFWQG